MTLTQELIVPNNIALASTILVVRIPQLPFVVHDEIPTKFN